MGHESRDRACVEIGERIVTGRLPAGAVLDESVLAVEVGVGAPIVREALCFLQRDGFVRESDEGAFSVSELDELELRETYPVVLLLEGLAVRSTPAYPDTAIARLREINADMVRDGDDAAAAATHDFRFHDEDVSQRSVVGLRPNMRVGPRADKLKIDMNFIGCLLHTPFQDVRDTELPGNFRQVLG